ncbi:hypothetical protein FF125_07620 [Aureibaculum algae]|uniref:Uncharacterized protein n=1 Tax=Aureibaculum algae TaxID=2584122 RepID=A0A5B7TTB0_9FLAO|nr:hypothetical protein [Aureibaculum algae]QCX38306.1 hypothetical protein FF125_07620 [Aureibaculum algae]
MRKTKSVLLYLIAFFLIGFISSCNNDALDVQEEAQIVPTLKGTVLKSATDRMGKFNYFRAKVDAGEDISRELYDYAMDMEIPNVINTPDYEFMRNQILGTILNPDDYNCNNSTIPLNDYVNNSISQWTDLDYIYYVFYSYHPQADAIYFKEPGYKKYKYGVNGEFTNQLNRTFKDLKRFWNINSSDIYMVPLSGSTYLNFDRLVEIEALYYPSQSDEENEFYAQFVQDLFGTETYWNYNHPLFSFNAFALSTTNSFIQDRIVMGDGILMGYAAIGLDDVAPQAILAHEFGHHIQFENGYFIDVAEEDQPEATRRTELMADAFAAYYLTHKRGATMNWKRVEQFLEVFYNIGDCGFDNPGHHGTYEQRLAAAKWGRDLASNSWPKGKILTSEVFYQLFEATLDDIVNCDNCLTEME